MDPILNSNRKITYANAAKVKAITPQF